MTIGNNHDDVEANPGIPLTPRRRPEDPLCKQHLRHVSPVSGTSATAGT